MLLPFLLATYFVTAASAQATPKVLPLKFHGAATPSHLQKRQNSLSAPITNVVFQQGYFVDICIGTPPQDVSVIVDTGSADLWAYAPGVCPAPTCRPLETIPDCCYGGTYTSNQSSSVSSPNMTQFSIAYGNGAGVDDPRAVVRGFFVQDAIQIGSATLTSVIMAQVTSVGTFPPYAGIIGLGYDRQEADLPQPQYPGIPGQAEAKTHSSFLDELVLQGIISSRAYSLYLDDRGRVKFLGQQGQFANKYAEQLQGTILFGGYDSEKYHGELTAVPLVVDSFDGNVYSMMVKLNSISDTSPSSTQLLDLAYAPVDVLLDSGTYFTYFPQSIVDQLNATFAFEPGPDSTLAVDCSFAQQNASLDFRFGNVNGPILRVPYSELVFEAPSGGPHYCIFGILPATGLAARTIFGDTFLRSAYVVYDVDSNMTYIAQTRFNSSSSNVQSVQRSRPLRLLLQLVGQSR
jgi:hypothetical protein